MWRRVIASSLGTGWMTNHWRITLTRNALEMTFCIVSILWFSIELKNKTYRDIMPYNTTRKLSHLLLSVCNNKYMAALPIFGIRYENNFTIFLSSKEKHSVSSQWLQKAQAVYWTTSCSCLHLLLHQEYRSRSTLKLIILLIQTPILNLSLAMWVITLTIYVMM